MGFCHYDNRRVSAILSCCRAKLIKFTPFNLFGFPTFPPKTEWKRKKNSKELSSLVFVQLLPFSSP